MPSCPVCKTRLPRAAGRCLKCGANLPRGRPLLSEADCRQLRALLAALPAQDAAARALAAKLDAAAVVPGRAIPPDIATIDARVAYRLGRGDAVHRRALVLPAHYVPGGQWLSVLSPLGAALLGEAAGAAVPYRDRCGASLPVALLQVEWQPEAHAFAAAD